MNKPDSLPESRQLYSRLMRHVRLRQLQLLLALQHSGSVVKAAQHLDMSQSAATQALGELERVLDLRLFERHARGMRATQAGQALIDATHGVMSELEDAAETLAAIRLGASAALRLGAIPAAAHTILAPLLARFYAQRPLVHVDVQEGEGARLLPLLIAGALDAVFCRQPALLPESHAFEPLLADEAVFIAAPSHPMASARKVRLAQLADARWVLPTSSVAVRDIFERVVLAQLPQAQWFHISTVSLPVLQGLLAQPGAVTLVPRSIMPALHHAGSLAGVCMLDMALTREALALAPLGAVYRREAKPTLLREMLALWCAP
ncbi:MAG: LysR family transcriptional regulator [Acidovorax soli]|uniref:LysR family transcriptional regulator n=1 Tax=Acidovorax soli TaxID=592050 RepID=UPI0026F18C74|nr:LysR family transcriptional regulator [Acidovorax soli]MCM2346524.1 LysR family transcriptional regulator [Acidovorax soli]